jgi:putative Mn2+ efflux pump MntP
MIRSGSDSPAYSEQRNPTRGRVLLLLSIATSIDAMAIGLTLSMLRLQLFYPSIIIGLVTCSMTVAGMIFGSRLHAVIGKRADIAGGIILFLIGLRVLYQHLFV